MKIDEKAEREAFEALHPYPTEELFRHATVTAVHRWQEAWESKLQGWLARAARSREPGGVAGCVQHLR